MDLGRVGIWGWLGRSPEQVAESAAAVEAAGYDALWIPGGAGGNILEQCDTALGATDSLVVATGILNIWRHDAAEVAAATERLGERFLLGLGVSHSQLIGEEYVAPLAKMSAYLDELDAAGMQPDRRVLAALRPKMLAMAAERSAGAHPYFVPPEHTVVAREALGKDRLLAPEQMVVLDTDPSTARETARQVVAGYLGLPNYANNLRRLGYTEADLAAPGTDRVVDAIVAWGSPATIATRVQAHFDAGADHVCIQVLGAAPAELPAAWQDLRAAIA